MAPSLAAATGGVLRVAFSRPMHHSHSPTLANAIAGPSRLPLPATAAPAPVLRQFVISVRSAHQYTRGELRRILPTMDELGLKSGDHVTVAMSGGVDSSPLKLNVVYMRNWDPQLSESQPDSVPSATKRAVPSLSYPSSEPRSSAASSSNPPSACQWERDWKDVQAVAKYVGIPKDKVKLVDFSKEYWSKVFEPSVGVWEAGGTPNPDVMCNKEIKFGTLVDQVATKPRHFLATGHYARCMRKRHATRLCRAKDMDKDQTYYLSSISEDQLKRAVFPLANLTKPWVRRLATHFGLPTADREESMGVCFIGERGNFGDFVSQYTSPPSTPGHIVDPSGKRLAEHDGLWHYTIGQRARVAGMDGRWFVAKKGVGESKQDILVVPGADHPALQCMRVYTEPFHWIADKVPKGFVAGGSKKAQVQVRHRMKPVTGILSLAEDGQGLICDFPEPVPAVAPGQVLVIWYQKWCLGSAVIRDTRVLSDKPESRSHVNYLAELARKAAVGEATTTAELDDGETETETGRTEAEEVDALGAAEDLGEMEEHEGIEVQSRQPEEDGDESEESKRKDDGVAEGQVGGRPSRKESSKGKDPSNKGHGTAPQPPQPSAVADGLALPLADAISKVVS
ncbi:hypothetical protein JCM24511_08996 [Saitozyma sp. JCM 24511]|nr:hypothetical protein JCM24511_08996 [Saitozyma sp. JCM 24511]